MGERQNGEADLEAAFSSTEAFSERKVILVNLYGREGKKIASGCGEDLIFSSSDDPNGGVYRTALEMIASQKAARLHSIYHQNARTHALWNILETDHSKEPQRFLHVLHSLGTLDFSLEALEYVLEKNVDRGFPHERDAPRPVPLASMLPALRGAAPGAETASIPRQRMGSNVPRILAPSVSEVDRVARDGNATHPPNADGVVLNDAAAVQGQGGIVPRSHAPSVSEVDLPDDVPAPMSISRCGRWFCARMLPNPAPSPNPRPSALHAGGGPVAHLTGTYIVVPEGNALFVHYLMGQRENLHPVWVKIIEMQNLNEREMACVSKLAREYGPLIKKKAQSALPIREKIRFYLWKFKESLIYFNGYIASACLCLLGLVALALMAATPRNDLKQISEILLDFK